MSKSSKVRKDVATTADESKLRSFVIPPKREASLCVEIGGESLIQNAFSQKAIEQMLRKHMGLSVQKEKKVPSKVIEAAIIRNVDDVVSMPVVAPKAAMLTASGALKTFEKKKTQLKHTLFIQGHSLPVVFEKMIPRMDMVRTSGMSRTPDVRFRPEFRNWKIRMIIVYSDTLYEVETILDLLNRAGSVGIGEWRPEKMGTHGTFQITRSIQSPAEVAEVKAACAVMLRTPEIPAWAMDLEIDPEVLGKLFSPSGDGESQAADESAAE